MISLAFDHLFLACLALLVWKLVFFPAQPPRTDAARMILWLGLMFACALALLLVLGLRAAPSVREDSGQISFYLILSFFSVALAQSALAFLGVSVRDDVAERGNRAASFAAAGFTAAATCCAGGANIGDGPGPEAVVFCAALALGALLALWTVVARVSGAADTITIERDLGAGIRVAGWLAGSGAVLGACVAGDWSSKGGTCRDFLGYAWPLAVVALAYALFERASRLRARRPGVPASVLSAAAMAAAGLAYAAWIGVGS